MSTDRSEVRDIIAVSLHSAAIEPAVGHTDGATLEIISRQAHSDEGLIALWLHGRPGTTAAVYRADAGRMIAFVGKPLAATTLGDLQAFADHLERSGLAPSTRIRILSSLKSLFGFGFKVGYLRFDVGRAVRLPKAEARLADRILDEGQVERMLMLEASPRNRMMLMVLYAAGLRVSELASLKWRDCHPRRSGGQLTVRGKGGRIRAVLLPASVWLGLVAIRRGAADEAPVFRSREGGHLHRSQLMRLVTRAARRAGIAKNVSPHWLRHAHVSHALDRGCPVHVVAQTVGHASLHSTTRYAHARPTDSSSTYLPI